MSRKIFISYRRDDSAASALGIGQYLEHEFGRKNVFIDVDMRAGSKFPIVLEQRLAECKVMLVLIGTGWLNSKDEQGRRRIDQPNDWVRLEIAHALKRNITVIPVRVNGAELPSSERLPEDIQGLLDHQAVSVSISSFRHEMAGLVRDIQSIPDLTGKRLWMAIGITTLAAACLVLVVARFSRSISFPISRSESAIWNAHPGEWVLYGTSNQWIGFYFQRSSLKRFGSAAAYAARFAFISPSAEKPPEKPPQQPAFEENTTVVDCKRHLALTAERILYDQSGRIVSRFTLGDPKSLDLSKGSPIAPGSILQAGERIACDDEIGAPLLSKEQVISKQQLVELNLLYLGPSPKNDGDIYYSPPKTASGVNYQSEMFSIINFHNDESSSVIGAGNKIIGLPFSFRTQAQTIRFFCSERKVQVRKVESYDSEGNLVAMLLQNPDVVGPGPGSPYEFLLGIACGANVAGTYEGTNQATMKQGGQMEQHISFKVEQLGSDLTVTFQTFGGQGKGVGKLTGNRVEAMSLQSTATDCPGSYEASFEFAGDTVNWTFKGQDCGGAMEGHGTAKRTKV